MWLFLCPKEQHIQLGFLNTSNRLLDQIRLEQWWANILARGWIFLARNFRKIEKTTGKFFRQP